MHITRWIRRSSILVPGFTRLGTRPLVNRGELTLIPRARRDYPSGTHPI